MRQAAAAALLTLSGASACAWIPPADHEVHVAWLDLDTGVVTGVDTGHGTTDLETGDTGDMGDTGETGDTGPVDDDGDGYPLSEDCDDGDPAVHPGAREVPCNDVDDDCDEVQPVEASFSEDDENLTAAVAAAAAAGAEAVCVAPGTYNEALDYLGADIAVVGIGGSATTTLDLAGTEGPIVQVKSGEKDAHLEGFTLTGAVGAAGLGLDVAGADVSLFDVVISGNTATCDSPCDGPFVRLADATVAFEQVIVRDNAMAQSAGGLPETRGLVYADDVDMTWSGGGIQENHVTLVQSSSEFTSKRVAVLGLFDGSNLGASDLELSDNVLDLDTSVSGGAFGHALGHLIWVSERSLADLSRVVVNDNTVVADADGAGDAIGYCYLVYVLDGSTLLWEGGTFSHNACSTSSTLDRSYARLFSINDGSVSLSGVDVDGNLLEAEDYVSGLKLQAGSVLSLGNVRFRDNELEAGQHGVVLGAVHDTSVLAGVNLVVANTWIESGGDGSATLFDIEGSLDLTNASITGNHAYAPIVEGAVIAAVEGASITLRNTTVDGNESEGTETFLSDVFYLDEMDDVELSYCNFYGQFGTDGQARSAAGDVWHPGLDVETNLHEPPGYRDTNDFEAANWDLALDPTSALINAGDPELDDADGSVSDIGAYGGEGAAHW